MIATGRRAERLDALAAELGDKLLPFPLDVTDTAAVDALPGSLPAAWQEIDLLVNNGRPRPGYGPGSSRPKSRNGTRWWRPTSPA